MLDFFAKHVQEAESVGDRAQRDKKDVALKNAGKMRKLDQFHGFRLIKLDSILKLYHFSSFFKLYRFMHISAKKRMLVSIMMFYQFSRTSAEMIQLASILMTCQFLRISAERMELASIVKLCQPLHMSGEVLSVVAGFGCDRASVGCDAHSFFADFGCNDSASFDSEAISIIVDFG